MIVQNKINIKKITITTLSLLPIVTMILLVLSVLAGGIYWASKESVSLYCESMYPNEHDFTKRHRQMCKVYYCPVRNFFGKQCFVYEEWNGIEWERKQLCGGQYE